MTNHNKITNSATDTTAVTTMTQKPTKSPEPQFHRAKKSVQELVAQAAKNQESDQWVTGLSFDTIMDGITSSFVGVPGKVEGEPLNYWVLYKCMTAAPHQVFVDALRYMMSIVVLEGVAKPYFDLSLRTKEGALASTVLVVDYKPHCHSNPLKTWWNALCSMYRENMFYFKLWRRGALPDLITSKTWTKESENWNLRLSKILECMGSSHSTLMTRRHWYINIVETLPDCQGQGYGSKVMQKIGELADAEGADCYVECANNKNKCFYEKFGYRVEAAHVLNDLVDKDDDKEPVTTMYVMVRRQK